MARKTRKEGGHEAQNLPHGKAGEFGAKPDSKSKEWVVVILEVAKKEGRKILSDFQYDHVVEILKRLVHFGNAEEVSDLKIEPIESFYELKEKGGILGRINLRVYFGTIPEEGELVVAKTYKKEDDGSAPRHVILVVEDRLEEYKTGHARKGDTVYQESKSSQ